VGADLMPGFSPVELSVRVRRIGKHDIFAYFVIRDNTFCGKKPFVPENAKKRYTIFTLCAILIKN
jgi:hypothetical protein